MRVALGALRGGAVPGGQANFARFGVMKYAACLAAGALGAVGCTALGAGFIASTVVAAILFYAVEAQFVFLFPLALDGKAIDWVSLRRSVRRAGGTCCVMATVVPIAARMIVGGLKGWCCGCLEVLLWYEAVRKEGEQGVRARRLIFGDGGPLELRRERVVVPQIRRPLRIAWVSDLHLGRRSAVRTIRAVLLSVRSARPDVIVLGGDLVDRASGLKQLAVLVRGLGRIGPVCALPGNHDVRFDEAGVRRTVVSNGGRWLPDGPLCFDDERVRLCFERPEANDDGADDARVACVHDPADAKKWRGNARVVLAGHLHGGQAVVANARGRWWPGAAFYRWCGPRFDLGNNTTLLVGRGVADTLPMRWRCPREIVCCELMPRATPDAAAVLEEGR